MHTCKTCWSRREFLFRSGGGVSGFALAYLLNQDRLLAGEPCSLAELAWRCGFADPAHFSRAFKCRFGAPPREFRKSR